MKRRTFLLQGGLLSTGYALLSASPSWASTLLPAGKAGKDELYELFRNPPAIYRPFVRWWWNGDKVEKAELIRELHVMKEAGIGGIEINPIKFPALANDLGKPTLRWLSPEWTDALEATLKEAKQIGLTSDLIVGSGWPFGAEYLEGEERCQLMVIGAKKLEGPLEYEVSEFEMLKEADPTLQSPFGGRTLDMVSLKLAPAKMSSLTEVRDLSHLIGKRTYKIDIPKGKWVLYAQVKITGFMEVINGAPGAEGPVLNHYDEKAVKKYLNHMTDSIQNRMGPLSPYIRSFFADSMEQEGANWTADMAAEFQKRRGYDLMPYFPFMMFKIGSMGNAVDYDYASSFTPDFIDVLQRVRYDFDLTKSELLEERFIKTFVEWCRENKVRSRAQAYGRGYFLLEGSFDIDIPECETWIKNGIGGPVHETNYRIGRANTMINKWVSSAAHLKGKRLISCEELTNTDMVFNDTLEIQKVAGDQSTISGVTHAVFHGFNYSPPDAPFPGWIRYGAYFSEHNTWWPHFRKFTDYKARFSALFQHADMFADIAVLPPVNDMWNIYSAQNEPFPTITHPDYLVNVWEAMHRCGNGCDYVSDKVIRDAQIKNGQLVYGPRSWHTLVLIQVERIDPETTAKLLQFVQAGGKIFCIETIPYKSLGLNNWEAREREVQSHIAQLKNYPDRFVFIRKPEKDFTAWYKQIQQQYNITPYVKVDQPTQYVTQVRYQGGDKEMLLFINSNMNESFAMPVTITPELLHKKQAWVWDADTGARYRMEISGQFDLNLGPAEARLLVFDKEKKGKPYKAPVLSGTAATDIPAAWQATFKHIDGTEKTVTLPQLKDLKELADWVNFSGTVTYRTTIDVTDKSKAQWLNLGKVQGVSTVTVNGKDAGTKWYGRRIYDLSAYLVQGSNTIEVAVVTTMGNYMKTLTDNPVAQYWTNSPKKNQPIQSMGLIGPVTCYGS
ncbi:glycoside hydrolase family 2 [Pseudoflavitalea sp. G-6-1-2]|uniref:glycosyl hydrolase n=1 Tax=Pseudoflavitalea sp. G-6-1-2 TaxID=2728841 RepID=UPI00146BBE94|nr:glycosyl hydrolase [Pseudoflavitalea sp. G-6-1-2]NML21744.1 glycoside hydrolase family 2 [Pseudoflavitalea sp. G-6-1-2]